METFVEEHVSAGRDVFPRRELTWLEVHAKTGVVFSRFFNAVEVVALLTSTGFAVGAEQFLELVEEVGLRTCLLYTSPSPRD